MNTEAGPPLESSTLIEALPVRRDGRGSLFEPLNHEELAHQKNVHVVMTAPDEVRGNHFHRSSVEITAVVGPCLVRLREGGATQDIEVPDGEIWRFTIPPGVVHAYRNTGSSTLLLVSFNSRVHDPENPDTVREEIL